MVFIYENKEKWKGFNFVKGNVMDFYYVFFLNVVFIIFEELDFGNVFFCFVYFYEV